MSTLEHDLTPIPIDTAQMRLLREFAQFQRIAGALVFELNQSAASGLISRKALLLISQLQQRTPGEYLAPLAGGRV